MSRATAGLPLHLNAQRNGTAAHRRGSATKESRGMSSVRLRVQLYLENVGLEHSVLSAALAFYGYEWSSLSLAGL